MPAVLVGEAVATSDAGDAAALKLRSGAPATAIERERVQATIIPGRGDVAGSRRADRERGRVGQEPSPDRRDRARGERVVVKGEIPRGSESRSIEQRLLDEEVAAEQVNGELRFLARTQEIAGNGPAELAPRILVAHRMIRAVKLRFDLPEIISP